MKASHILVVFIGIIVGAAVSGTLMFRQCPKPEVPVVTNDLPACVSEVDDDSLPCVGEDGVVYSDAATYNRVNR